MDLPYMVEYAKSNRSSCRKCKNSIAKDSMRMGIMVQSPRFDGKVPMWHHLPCFFAKKQLTSTGDVANFDSLRYEDQKKIKDGMAGGAGTSNGGGKKSKKAAASAENLFLNEFAIEYAKSGKSSCKICLEKIVKGEVRISKLDYESDTAIRFGPSPAWHHVDCFVKNRETFRFTESGEKLPGFAKLSEEDKEMIKKKIKPKSAGKRKAEAEEQPAKKPKVIDAKEEKALKAQSKLIYGFRDNLQKFLKKKDMIALLEHNSQEIPSGESALMDRLSDCLAFGALKPCPECKGQIKFSSYTYRCTGYSTGWTKCLYVTKQPEKGPFVIPDEFKDGSVKDYDFLKKYKYVKRDRVIGEEPELPVERSAAASASSKPLDKFRFAIIGNLKRTKLEADEVITKYGGKFVKKFDKTITCVITTKDEAENKNKFKSAETHMVYVVAEEFLDDVATINGNASLVPMIMKKHMIFSWGQEAEEILPKKATKSADSLSSGSSQKITLAVGGKAAVDPGSGLEYTHHVVEKKKNVYNAVLGKVDVIKGTNSFYKLQLLKHNQSERYVLFRAWGRVGTTIGDSTKGSYDTFEDAVFQFEKSYLDQTGNEWKNRHKFVKQPSRYYPLDIDYGQDQSAKLKTLKPESESKLALPIQELICMIFDVDAMKKAMLEFEIDLKKMPLGKLSKKQIRSAYSILTEVQNILKGDKNATKILDASNRFYTLIPHDFGMKKPPLLDNEILLQAKTQMLESLLEIECAYTLLQGNVATKESPIDQHYEKLKTDIEVLDKKSAEFERIKTYIQNTHAPTHRSYKLRLEEVFKVSRHGEFENYKQFQNLHNKKLLWHGSRVTNFAGILSQGLRIAPPEAPSTGYMFGKGIYFADMVSKSANYCFTSQSNPTGILLLCEVALGNMYERTNAEYVEKLPKDKHSTKGLGDTEPNPQGTIVENDVEIPMGKPLKSTGDKRTLLYNEFIVYDVKQVNIKYLLKVKFDWSS